MRKSVVLLALAVHVIYTGATEVPGVSSSSSSASASSSSSCSSPQPSSSSASSSSSSSSSGSKSSSSSSAFSQTACQNPPPEAPICNANEVYSNCTQAVCGAQYCSQKGQPMACAAVAEGDCNQGCVCAENYLRDSSGNCVPPDQCGAPTCNANEVYSNCTQAVCGAQYCSQKGQPMACAAVAEGDCNQGCVCAENYLRDSSGNCVPPDQCGAPTCNANEVYSNCTQAVCGAQYCSQKGQPMACAAVAEGDCNQGCVCAENYLRDSSGNCVPPDQCGAPTCNANEVYSNCTQAVCGAQYCSQKGQPMACAAVAEGDCNQGCVCAENYLRDSSGNCVPPDQCGAPTCNSNEVYTNCTQAVCGAQYCSQKGQPMACAAVAEGDCNQGCVCAENYLRDSSGNCVPPDQCGARCDNPNEVYDACPAPCPPRLCGVDPALIQCQVSPQPGDANCEPGCRCADNYVRNDKGVCIPKEQCPPTCNANEVYSNCTQAVCRAQYCSQKGQPIACRAIAEGDCNQGCVCADNYLRDSDGNCVPEDQCDASTCGQDEVFSSCANGGCGRTYCSQLNEPELCSDPIKCEGGCLCRDGYLRNGNGICVPQDQCETAPTCQVNEVFSNCTEGVCRNLDCSQKGKDVACVDIIDGTYCTSGCVCAENYLRAANGTCVPEDQCDGVSSSQSSASASSSSSCSSSQSSSSSTSSSSASSSSNASNKGSQSSSSSSASSQTACQNQPPKENKCTRPNEVYDRCPAKCPFRTCGIDDRLVKCESPPEVGNPDCPPPACRCENGYFRDDKGNCVEWENCPRCDNPNEVYDACPAPCPPRICGVDPASTLCQVSPQPGDASCEPGCRCADNYVRNDKGVCIPKDQCPPTCNANEVLSNCTQAVCRAQYCSQKGQPIACSEVAEDDCKQGCVCADNYLRDSDGNCVPEDQCGGTTVSCKGDPNAQPGCGVNCGRLCSNYQRDDVSCIQVCYDNACDCKKNYVLDTNTGKCVLPDQCTPTCNANEVFSNCTQAVCRAQYCSQKGQPIACSLIAEGYCKQGCVCAENYLRDSNGNCVPEDQCNAVSCNGDPNAQPGCGVNCGRLCSNYQRDDVVCPAICYANACDCKKGYVLDSYIDKCVLPEECSTDQQQCNKPNEEYQQCPDCSPGTCESIGRKYKCPFQPADPSQCKGECRCKPGYYRNIIGDCITEAQCLQCNGTNEYFSCGSACDNVCATLDQQNQTNCPIINIQCNKMCYCEDGYARDENNICVPIDQCPRVSSSQPSASASSSSSCSSSQLSSSSTSSSSASSSSNSSSNGSQSSSSSSASSQTACQNQPPKGTVQPQCNQPNEEYQQCPDCSPGTCDSIGRIYKCPAQPADPSQCKGECRCKPGYYRNIIGECITEEQCQQCNGTNEYFSCGPECDNVCATLDQQNKTNCPIINVQCNKMCYCEDGYARDENNICVPIDQCPPGCKENERYVECPDAECVPQYCADAGFPIACPRIIGRCPSKPACICNSGYLRNAEGVCVPQNECPTCGGDPNAKPGCGTNCDRLCSNYQLAKSQPIACPDICNLNGCDCIDGYVLDTNTGKCVLPEQCTTPCGENEVYSDCVNGGCDKRNCSQINDPKICLHPKTCEEGCVCQNGYLRDSNGVCVPEDQCEGKCPAGETFSDCPPVYRKDCNSELCPQSRNDPDVCATTRQCGEPRCVCEYLRKRNRETGQCVLANECPPFHCDGKNEVYDSCPPSCPGENCSDYIKNSTCSTKFKIGVVVPCKPACRCKKNMYRNSKGVCVKADECECETS